MFILFSPSKRKPAKKNKKKGNKVSKHFSILLLTQLNNKLDKEVPTHAIYSLNTQLNNLFLKKLKNLEVCSFVTDITKSKNRQASDRPTEGFSQKGLQLSCGRPFLEEIQGKLIIHPSHFPKKKYGKNRITGAKI